MTLVGRVLAPCTGTNNGGYMDPLQNHPYLAGEICVTLNWQVNTLSTLNWQVDIFNLCWLRSSRTRGLLLQITPSTGRQWGVLRSMVGLSYSSWSGPGSDRDRNLWRKGEMERDDDSLTEAIGDDRKNQSDGTEGSNLKITRRRTSNHTLVCALISSSSSPQESSLNCTSFPQEIQIPLNPSVSFSGMVGGNGFLCGLTSSDPTVMVCWRFSNNGTDLTYKRIYLGPLLTNLDSGNSQICGIVNRTNRLQCWQWHEFSSSNRSLITSNLVVGQDFVCGLLRLGQIQCLGSFRDVVDAVPSGNYSEIAAGSQHACAISRNGSLVFAHKLNIKFISNN
ncbi:hypothetical protein BC332_11488 [Capsicum chinense]|nr:hypothetical protein BC332_11488 [Capsicum chinense]